MRFALAYSCGKDSTFALHKMLQAGHEPALLVTLFREDQNRSWFHGATKKMLAVYEQALAVPLVAQAATGANYAEAFESALKYAICQKNITACAFGDIDLEANRRWEEMRCEKVGIKSVFPLWNMPRAVIIRELLDAGYKCVIKTINTTKLQHLPQARIEDLAQKYLGQYLDAAFISELENLGCDACGENGEYHTLAVDGPIFKQPVHYETGAILKLPGQMSIELDFSAT